MFYAFDPNSAANAVTAAFNGLVALEKRTLSQLGAALDASFNAIWAPAAPVTPAAMVAACGTNFMARLQTHAALATIVLALESANGLSSAKHPWAVKQTDGSFLPGTPAAWTITPAVDANGNPTGAATIAPATPS